MQDLEKIKAGRMKEVVLESGMTVKVRIVNRVSLSVLGIPLPGPEVDDNKRRNEYTRAILVAGIVSPKVGDGEGEFPLELYTTKELDKLEAEILGRMGVSANPLPEDEGPLAGTVSPEGTQETSTDLPSDTGADRAI